MPRDHRNLCRLTALLLAAGALACAASAEEPDPVAEAEASLAIVEQAKTLCAEAPESIDCFVADRRAVAIVANAIGEAGHSRDRGQFLNLVRAYLSHREPQLRAAAAHALANLGPDDDDTPVLRGLLRDPIGTVRNGARVAAERSSDPAIRLAALRFPELPSGMRDLPDPLPFDPAALGLALPEGAEFLWLAAKRRETGELQFLTPGSVEETRAHFAGLTGRSPMTLAEALEPWPELQPVLSPIANRRLFADMAVVPFGGDGALPPTGFVVVYRDLLFDSTGFAVLFADRRSLIPPEPPGADQPLVSTAPPDEAALAAAIREHSVFKPEAPPEESDLFMAIVAAWGYGAADYLELYPGGAYAAEAQAYLDAPRMRLDAVRYGETDVPLVTFYNLPAGSSASLSVESAASDYAVVGTAEVADVMEGPVPVEMPGWQGPGVHLLRAEVTPPDGSDHVFLVQDFSVEAILATLTLGKTGFAPGETIDVRFSGMSGADDDYVSVAPAGSSNTTYLSYVYTHGAVDGAAELMAPSAPGAYEVRAFFREDETVMRARVPFMVEGVAAAPDTPAVTAAPTAAPTAAAGVPADDARATLTLDKASYAPGEAITVTYSGMFGAGNDYINTAEAGSPNNRYIAYEYTAGATEGVVTLTAPTTPGAYEMRAFFQEDETILRAGVPFVVEGVAAAPTAPPGEPADDARATLTLDKASYAPGETITVTYSGMFGDRQDYINTAEADAPNNRYIAYQYTAGATEGVVTLTAPTTPGAYEMRAFFREDETILRASVPFVVE
jgi:hypothetical protein